MAKYWSCGDKRCRPWQLQVNAATLAVAGKRTSVAEVEAKAASCGAAGAVASVCSMCASAASSTCVTAGIASWEDRARAGAGVGAELATLHGVTGACAPAAAFLRARPLREAAGAGAAAGAAAAAATSATSKAEGAPASCTCSAAKTAGWRDTAGAGAELASLQDVACPDTAVGEAAAVPAACCTSSAAGRVGWEDTSGSEARAGAASSLGVAGPDTAAEAGTATAKCVSDKADWACGCTHASAAVPAASCTAATAGVAGWEDRAGAEVGAEPAGSPGTAGSDTDAGVAATVRFSTDIEGGGWAVTEGADLASSP